MTQATPPADLTLKQLPRPVAWAGSSDRNFYDRCYLNAHDRAIAHGPGADGVEGWGPFEHGALGRHDPSGFQDWFDLAEEQHDPRP
jgi:hypothetical protein